MNGGGGTKRREVDPGNLNSNRRVFPYAGIVADCLRSVPDSGTFKIKVIRDEIKRRWTLTDQTCALIDIEEAAFPERDAHGETVNGFSRATRLKRVPAYHVADML